LAFGGGRYAPTGRFGSDLDNGRRGLVRTALLTLAAVGLLESLFTA
jgi:hypothetical protein